MNKLQPPYEIDYEWMYTYEEDYSEREGGLVSKKVSDWDNSQTCVYCGKEIVHVYYIKDKTGKVYILGKECLKKATGLPKRQLEKAIYALQAEKRDYEYRIEQYKRALEIDSADTRGEANLKANLYRLKGHEGKRAFLIHKKTGKFISIIPESVNEYLEAGEGNWKVYKRQ